MTHPTEAALSAVRALEQPHRYAHTCDDREQPPGVRWYRNGDPCPAWDDLQTIRASLEHLHEAVHTAAHTPATVDTVAAAMLSGPLSELDTEQQDGWRHLTRLALERLSEVLQRDTAVQDRARAASDRLGL